MSRFAHAGRLIVVAAVLGVGAGNVATAAAEPSKLMGMLPEGFSSGNCEAKTPTAPAIEKVTCSRNTVAGGPLEAAFGLFGNVDDMNSGFKNVGVSLSSSCPGGQQSPGPWTYGTDGKTGGQVECGTATSDAGKTAPIVVWSDDSKLRVAAVVGDDITSLYQWWKTKSG